MPKQEKTETVTRAQDHPAVLAMKARKAELLAKKKELTDTLGTTTADSVKQAAAGFQENLNRPMEVQKMMTSNDREQLQLQLAAVNKAIEGIDAEIPKDIAAAGAPLWAASKAGHIVILQSIEDMALACKDALSAESDHIAAVKKRAGGAGRPTPLVENAQSLYGQLDKLIQQAQSRRQAYEHDVAKSKK